MKTLFSLFFLLGLFITNVSSVYGEEIDRTGRHTYFTGVSILNWCKKEDEISNILCVNYLKGLYDGAALPRQVYKLDAQFCKPLAVSGNQMRLIFLKYAREHPERLHESAAPLLFSALADAYPCPRP